MLHDWGECSTDPYKKARETVSDLLNAVKQSWVSAIGAHGARSRTRTIDADTVRVSLTDTPELNKKRQAARAALNIAIAPFQNTLAKVHTLASPESARELKVDGSEEVINRIHDLARAVGPGSMMQTDEHHASFLHAEISGFTSSMFIVAPAGFGKTSFCRWHALDDVESLLQRDSGILPVYVPLHKIGDIDKKDFKSAFLHHAGVSALMPKDGKIRYERTRVYLDGLDEVPSQTTQKYITDTTRKAIAQDPTLQVIITARDYVYGPWIAWMPRVQLSGFDENQIKELAQKWLESTNTAGGFFEQLDKSPSLRDMMSIPLLATLTVLVFKQTGRLPENKTRLYEIFIDLHNGGWDLVKGFQRASRFTASQKMYILKRIAMLVHSAKGREMRDVDFASLVAESCKYVDWNALRDELLRDGLLIQLGSTISFAHHSYQEFLAAKYLIGDPTVHSSRNVSKAI